MGAASRVDIWNKALGRAQETEVVENEDDDTLAARVCLLEYDDALKEVLEQIPWAFARKQAVIPLVDTQTVSYLFGVQASLTDFEIQIAFSSSTQVSVKRNSTTLTVGTDYNVIATTPQRAAHIVLTSDHLAGETIAITVNSVRIGWEHVYTLPNDAVTPRALLDTDQRTETILPEQRTPFTLQVNDAGDGIILLTNALIGTDFETLDYISLITHVPMFPANFTNALTWRLAAPLAAHLAKKPALHDFCMGHYLDAVDVARADMLNIEYAGIDPITPSLLVRSGVAAPPLIRS